MTSRERFRETMRFGAPDRAPLFEEGLRDGVLERWRGEGLPEGADLAGIFEYDRRERIDLDLTPRPPVEQWPKARRDLGELRRRFDPDDPGRLPQDWAKRVSAWRGRDHLLELYLHPGFFQAMGVGGWGRFEEVVYQLADDPVLVRDILDLRSNLAARMAERVLSEVDVDFVSFSEPSGGNNGPILSPRQYREVVLPSYRLILDAVRRHGVQTIMFIAYANPRPLLADVFEAGFNCLWACEVNMETMDYGELRRTFGRSLRLIGGIDLDAVLGGPEAIRSEIERKVPHLLAQGGYIPLADGRVRENVPFRDYAFYRRLLEETVRGHGRGA